MHIFHGLTLDSSLTISVGILGICTTGLETYYPLQKTCNQLSLPANKICECAGYSLTEAKIINTLKKKHIIIEKELPCYCHWNCKQCYLICNHFCMPMNALVPQFSVAFGVASGILAPVKPLTSSISRLLTTSSIYKTHN